MIRSCTYLEPLYVIYIRVLFKFRMSYLLGPGYIEHVMVSNFVKNIQITFMIQKKNQPWCNIN